LISLPSRYDALLLSAAKDFDEMGFGAIVHEILQCPAWVGVSDAGPRLWTLHQRQQDMIPEADPRRP
jgi:hypothetical protein